MRNITSVLRSGATEASRARSISSSRPINVMFPRNSLSSSIKLSCARTRYSSGLFSSSIVVSNESVPVSCPLAIFTTRWPCASSSFDDWASFARTVWNSRYCFSRDCEIASSRCASGRSVSASLRSRACPKRTDNRPNTPPTRPAAESTKVWRGWVTPLLDLSSLSLGIWSRSTRHHDLGLLVETRELQSPLHVHAAHRNSQPPLPLPHRLDQPHQQIQPHRIDHLGVLQIQF